MKKSRGGRRPGAGRPPGKGKFREATRPVRIPESLLPHVSKWLDEYRERLEERQAVNGEVSGVKQACETPSRLTLPLYLSRISAGFPSPAEDCLEGGLDLNEHLVQHPAATFFLRVEGDSMTGAGIYPGDMLIVDRALEPRDGKIIVAALNGEFTVKRIRYRDGAPVLVPENSSYREIPVNCEMEFFVWGVVTSVIHQV